jgi:tetratricopeptide (TPR) repeat protein
MALIECNKCQKQISDKAIRCPHCGKRYKRKKQWHQRTSVTLCVATVLILIGFGFIHVITGVTSRFGLPFDIALKKSIGYKETFIDARKITSIPYVTAKINYPISCEVLQRTGYIRSGIVFETGMKELLLEKIYQWQSEFQESLNKPVLRWQDKLQETEIKDKNATDAENYNNRGVTSAVQGQYERAIADFGRAVRRNPQFATAYYNRGLVYYHILGQTDRAVSDFTKVIEITPDFTDGYMNRGEIYVKAEEYEKAISDFSQVIKINPEYVEAYFNRSIMYFALGRYDETWEDVYKIEAQGHRIPDDYLRNLQKVSQ